MSLTQDFDFILHEVVGGGGVYQWTVLLAFAPLLLVDSVPLALHMFTAFEPRFRCFIPDCDSLEHDNEIDAAYVDFALPKEYSSSEILSTDEKFDPCKIHVREFLTNDQAEKGCQAEFFQNATIEGCHSYVYDTSLFAETLTTKFNLVCQQESKQRLLGTIMMLGLMIGSPIGGQLTDKFGRKKILFWSTLLVIPFTIFSGYSPNYTCYLILRLITCTLLPCIWIANHNIVLEIFDPANRKAAVIAKSLFWPLCQLALILQVYLVRHWINMHLVIGCTGLLCLPSFFLIPESPRWLANNGRKEDAEEILLKMAKWNRKEPVTLAQRQQIRNVLNKIEEDSHQKTEINLNVANMFRKANLNKTLIMLFNWITINVGAYTLLLNTTSLHGNTFVNYVLSTLVGDLPSSFVMMITMKCFNRRMNLFIMQMIVGLSCLIIAFVPKEQSGVILAFFLIGKCGSNGCFILIWTITSELFPTNLRSQAIGLCSTVARVFGLVCPFIASLALYWKPLPMLVLGLPSVLAGILGIMLPETDGKQLPQNMKDTFSQRLRDSEPKVPTEIK